MMLTILRFAAILGPTVDTPWVRFLREPRAPTLLGFDPVMQIVHEDDVVAALVHAVHCDVPGVFNIAAEDAMPLSKIRSLAGKPPFGVFHPLLYWGAKRWAGNPSLAGRYLPMDPDYLRYPWVGDLARMRDEMEFVPAYTAEDTLIEFAQLYREGNVQSSAELQALQENRLRVTIEKRQRAQDRQAGALSGAEKGKDDE
jgi:UDP-glucose 4-epimerase